MDKYCLETYQNILPNQLISQGISLEKIGINEYIWNWKDAIEVVEFLSQQGYLIYGGDVYFENNGEYKPTYDSWTLNKTKTSISNENILESKKHAIEYIVSYIKKNSDKYFFTIVAGGKTENE